MESHIDTYFLQNLSDGLKEHVAMLNEIMQQDLLLCHPSKAGFMIQFYTDLSSAFLDYKTQNTYILSTVVPTVSKTREIVQRSSLQNEGEKQFSLLNFSFLQLKQTY